VRVYRLCKEIYAAAVLDGEGGRLVGGRWHSQGRRIVYCASGEALSVLELRVHLGPYVPHAPYVMHTLDVSDQIVGDLRDIRLPAGWNAVPHTAASQWVGDEWLSSLGSAALRVPSIHSQTEWNILLNPAHGDFGRVRIVARRPYEFDPRLFGRAEREG